MSDLVGYLEDRFSDDKAHIIEVVKNKGMDQLHSSAADLCFCFLHMPKAGFLMTRLIKVLFFSIFRLSNAKIKEKF